MKLELFMDQLISLILKNGLKPIFIDQEIDEISKKVTRSELIALFMLHQRDPSTMSQLASDMGLPLSTVTNIRQRLTRRGFIKHYRDSNDRRVILLSLTPEGQMLANKVLETMNRVIQKVKEVLTSEELEQLTRLIMKITTAVQSNSHEEKKEPSTFKRIIIEDEE
jgi:DNA-binding MarR family transcriptional regulator